MPKPGDKFYINARGVTAEGLITETGFKVLKGSYVIPTHKPYLPQSVVKHREECKADGTIVDNFLTKDVEFSNSSNRV